MKPTSEVEMESEFRDDGLQIQDVVMMLWRHRWKILVSGSLGVAAAASLYFSPSFESESKLLVRYVLSRSGIDAEFEPQRNISQGVRIIRDEIDILTSTDLAEEVAAAIGPERIIPNSKEPVDAVSAGKVILKGLDVGMGLESSVIRVTYRNADSKLTIEVLEEMIRRYFDKHLDVHRSGGAEFVAKQTNVVGERLRSIEEEIKQLMHNAGIVSVNESLALVDAQRSKFRAELQDVEAQLAAQQARVRSLEAVIASKSADEEAPAGGEASEGSKPTEEEIARFQVMVDTITHLRKRNQDLLTKFSPSNPLVATNRRQLEEVERERRELALKHPVLLTQVSTDSPTAPKTDINAELAMLAGLEARKEILRRQFSQFEEYAADFPELIAKIKKLERRKEIEEEKYTYFVASLEKAQIDAALDPSKMPNINVIQKPSQPIRALDSSVKKMMILLVGAGGAFGIGLALLIELFLDRRIKSPREISRSLRIPLFLSVPFVRGRDDAAKSEALLRYARDILDRLKHSFRHSGRQDSPKLIAFTGAEQAAGSTTLSRHMMEEVRREGEEVILIDMRAASGEEFSVQEAEERLGMDEGRSEAQEAGARVSAKRLEALFQQIRQSDFDYVLFDLPPVAPGSPTWTMAGEMDKVFLLASADQTQRDELKRVYEELSEAGADVACICNKVGAPEPNFLMQFLFRRRSQKGKALSSKPTGSAWKGPTSVAGSGV